MPSDRVVVQFIVTAEMPNDEDEMDAILSELAQTVEGLSPEATNVFADIMDVEDIT